MSKRRPKNKQEMSSRSGKKQKNLPKIIRIKQVVDFQFTSAEGEVLKRPEARIKINPDGGVSCLVKKDEGWYHVRGHIDWIKIKKVIIRDEKKRK